MGSVVTVRGAHVVEIVDCQGTPPNRRCPLQAFAAFQHVVDKPFPLGFMNFKSVYESATGVSHGEEMHEVPETSAES